MKTNAILLAAAALALAACATTPGPVAHADGMPQVVLGVSTRADVDKLMGKPTLTIAPTAKSPATVAYEYQDFFGYREQLWITYNDKGIVLSKFSERLGS